MLNVSRPPATYNMPLLTTCLFSIVLSDVAHGLMGHGRPAEDQALYLSDCVSRLMEFSTGRGHVREARAVQHGLLVTSNQLSCKTLAVFSNSVDELSHQPLAYAVIVIADFHGCTLPEYLSPDLPPLMIY